MIGWRTHIDRYRASHASDKRARQKEATMAVWLALLYNCTSMDVVVDTSVMIAVLVREPHRDALVRVTASAELIAPLSVHWEIGNAFSAMFKRRRITLRAAQQALSSYRAIPIRFSDVALERTLEVAHELHLYAYDAYVIVCALQHRCPLLSLDQRLVAAATEAGIRTLEIPK